MASAAFFTRLRKAWISLSRLPGTAAATGRSPRRDLDAVGRSRSRRGGARGRARRMDVDGLRRQRPLVAEHLHAVDEIADAVGLRADELGQRAVLVLRPGSSSWAAPRMPDSGFLISCASTAGHARYGARGGAMRQLALDHLRHRALLQHQHDQARLLGHARRRTHRPAWCTPLRGRSTSTPYSLTVAPVARTCPTSAQQRAPKAMMSGSVWRFSMPWLSEKKDSAAQVGIDDAVVVAEHQDGCGRAASSRSCSMCRRGACDGAAPRSRAGGVHAAISCSFRRGLSRRTIRSPASTSPAFVRGAQPPAPSLDGRRRAGRCSQVPADVLARDAQAEPRAVLDQHRLDVLRGDRALLGERRRARIVGRSQRGVRCGAGIHGAP